MKHKQYLKIYIFSSLLFITPFIVTFLFIFRAGELKSVDEIVHIQHNSNAIYGSAYSNNSESYKLALARFVQPKICTLGSSRVLQLRQESFKESFANYGGVVTNLAKGERFLVKLLAEHVPEIIIMGLDCWWFNPNFLKNQSAFPSPIANSTITTAKLTKPLWHLFRRKISFKDFYETILSAEQANTSLTRFPRIGVKGLMNSSGFRKDGSMFYGDRLLKDDTQIRLHAFEANLAQIESGSRYFMHGAHVDSSALAHLEAIVNLCKEKEVKLIFFFPPFAPSIWKAMQDHSQDYAYIRKISSILQANGIEIHNFHDIRPLNGVDSEFLDGFHGGDIAFQRVLLKLASKEPYWAKWIAIDNVKNNIKKFTGQYLTISQPQMYKVLPPSH